MNPMAINFKASKLSDAQMARDSLRRFNTMPINGMTEGCKKCNKRVEIYTFITNSHLSPYASSADEKGIDKIIISNWSGVADGSIVKRVL